MRERRAVGEGEQLRECVGAVRAADEGRVADLVVDVCLEGGGEEAEERAGRGLHWWHFVPRRCEI